MKACSLQVFLCLCHSVNIFASSDLHFSNNLLILLYFSAKYLTFAARIKTGIKLIFSLKKQGNEQLRIDGDFHPCAF